MTPAPPALRKVDNRRASPPIGLLQCLAMAGHDGTDPDNLHTMTLSELEERVAAAGVLISRRQLMRHCEAQTFDAKRLPAVNNVEQWFIAPASVEKGIADIKTLQELR